MQRKVPARLRALVYTRVSHDRANGRSPAEQEADARDVCKREGWTIAEVITDSAGASRHSKGTRQGWQRAKQLVANADVDVLVTWEASRAQRDLKAYAELRDLCSASGVLWCYKGRVHDLTRGDDRFNTGLDALIAERESDETRDRVLRATRAQAEKGKPHGRRLYGYQRVYNPDTGALETQVPLEPEAAVVRRLYAGYLAGRGLRTLARDLEADGIKTSTGRRWADAQVRRVLSNPAYAARRVFQGEVVGAADWPPLVDDDTFDRVQARFELMRERNVRQSSTARLLTGVARCGKCGQRCSVIHDRNHRKVYMCHENYCVGRDMVKLDAYVTDAIVRFLSEPGAAAAIRGGPADAEVDEARAEADRLRRQLDDALHEFTAGRMSATLLARVEADLRPKIETAEKQTRKVPIPLAIDVPDTDVAGWWENELSPEQRREIVGSLLAAVVIRPTTRGSRRFDPRSVEIAWR
jgi:DNA invertase Pin-like site-specific DNA recombinase